MAGLDNIASMIPVLAAGFSKNPGTVKDAINMSRAGRQDREESRLREFGRILFSSGKMPESEAEIMEAAKAAGVQDFTKVMPMIGNYMKYRQDNEAFARSKERPFEITDENGNVRRVMANPNEAPDGAVPGQTSYRAPLMNVYDDATGGYRTVTQRGDTELGGVPIAAHLANENRRFQGEQNALTRRAADARAVRAASMKGSGSSYKPELFINPNSGEHAWVRPGESVPSGFIKDRSGMSLTTNKDGGVSFSTGVGASANNKNGMQRSSTAKAEKAVMDETVGLSDLLALGKHLPNVEKYLTYKGRVKKGLIGFADKAGFDVSQSAGKFFDDANDLEKSIGQWFDAYRKRITGAAAAFAELEKIKKNVINWDQGPREFRSAYNQLVTKSQRLLRLQNKFLREGLSGKAVGDAIDGVWKTGGDDIGNVNARGEELEESGLTEDQVTQQLIEEGYITPGGGQ